MTEAGGPGRTAVVSLGLGREAKGGRHCLPADLASIDESSIDRRLIHWLRLVCGPTGLPSARFIPARVSFGQIDSGLCLLLALVGADRIVAFWPLELAGRYRARERT